MCRIFGCVAAEPVSIRHELLDAENPMIRQSEEHDSGWGMAAYEYADGGEPRLVRFPEAAYADGDFRRATSFEGRIFNVHVRRATMGGLTMANTHPFCLDSYSFSHNGTVLQFASLLEPGVCEPRGETDSEHVFNFLMRDLDPGDVPGSLRRVVTSVVERSAFSGINVLFSDGARLYAYRLGIFELRWLARSDRLMVASEEITDERWHAVGQDVLLTLDPRDLTAPRSERLVGDSVLARARIEKFEAGTGLRGSERGAFAAQRAAQLASSPPG